MKFRLLSLTLLLSLLLFSAVAVTPAGSQPAAAQTGLTLPINLPLTFGANNPLGAPIGSTGTLSGTLDIASFTVQNGQLVALGTLNGTLANATNTLTKTLSVPLTLPVSNLQGHGNGHGNIKKSICSLVFLDLGPINLSVLGLDINTNEIMVNIGATPGAGLLGDLICGLTGKGPLNLFGLADTLNRLLDLGGLTGVLSGLL